MSKPLVALALAASACIPTAQVTASSRTYLGSRNSGAVTTHAVEDTAREVTRLFEVRGYALLDQRVTAPGGERLLKYTKTNRLLAAEKPDEEFFGANDVGSVFYAWVTPHDDGSTVSLLGKPTLAGVEPCTNDGVVLACTPLSANPDLARRYLSAHIEADTAHGILAQLALEGYATRPLPAATPAPADPAAVAQIATCKAERRSVLLRAAAEKDADERTKLFQSAPSC